MTNKSPLLVLGLLIAATSFASAQDSTPRPAVGIGSKTMESCKADEQKYCAQAPDALHKECLVKNWDRISSDCQDAVAMPGRGGGGGGD